MDIERLKHMAAQGDNDAIDAVIREAARRSDGSMVDLAWALNPARGVLWGMRFPISAYPEHLQGVHSALACALYRLETAFPLVTHYRNGVEGNGGSTLVLVQVTKTARGGRLSGGFTLAVNMGEAAHRPVLMLNGSLTVYNKSGRSKYTRLDDRSFSWFAPRAVDTFVDRGDVRMRGTRPEALRALALRVCEFYRSVMTPPVPEGCKAEVWPILRLVFVGRCQVYVYSQGYTSGFRSKLGR